VNATFQHATFVAGADPLEIGKKLLRQPDVRLLLTPSYDVVMGDWTTRGWKWDRQLYGQNLRDRHDATEVDSRSTVAANFRPTLDRSVNLGLSYNL
jgi:hypothetical protein